MANKILNTPGGTGQVPAGKVLVGKDYTGNLSSFNGKIFVIDLEDLPDPYNPLNLPLNTIRVKFKSGYTPDMGDTRTLVDSTNNVWDIEENNSWDSLFYSCDDLLEVLGANSTNVTIMYHLFGQCHSLTSINLFDTSNVTNMGGMFHQCTLLETIPQFNTSNVTDMGWMFNNCPSLISVPLFETNKVTDMQYMFNQCYSLTSVPLFDTSNVTNMESMLSMCSLLTSIPLFNTSKVTNMNWMADNCSKVETGALALYQQASSQGNPPTNHTWTFKDCGKNTQTGAAELAQIPSDWK